jgi:hypothetical protein
LALSWAPEFLADNWGVAMIDVPQLASQVLAIQSGDTANKTSAAG